MFHRMSEQHATYPVSGRPDGVTRIAALAGQVPGYLYFKRVNPYGGNIWIASGFSARDVIDGIFQGLRKLDNGEGDEDG